MPELMFELKDVRPFMFRSSTWRAVADAIWSVAQDGTFSRSKMYDLLTPEQAQAAKDARMSAEVRNVPSIKQVIQREYIRSEMIRVSDDEQARLMQGEDPTKVEAWAQGQRDMAKSYIKTQEHDINKIMISVLDKAVKALEDGTHVTGIPTPHKFLNDVTGGWQPSDLVIIAGRPGMGKTAWAVDIAYHAWAQGIPGLFVSMEMSAEQIVQRLQQRVSCVSPEKLRTGRMTKADLEAMQKAMPELYEMPIHIDDRARELNDIKFAIREAVAKHHIKFVIVDYMQQVSISGLRGDRNLLMTEVSEELKGIAKELDITIFPLSQLSRAVEQRGGDKRPQLSDLRDSGAIEQAADIIIFPYRPWYYNITQDHEGNDISKKTELIVAKNRHGRTGSEWVEYDELRGCLVDEINVHQPALSNVQIKPGSTMDVPF